MMDPLAIAVYVLLIIGLFSGISFGFYLWTKYGWVKN